MYMDNNETISATDYVINILEAAGIGYHLGHVKDELFYYDDHYVTDFLADLIDNIIGKIARGNQLFEYSGKTKDSFMYNSTYKFYLFEYWRCVYPIIDFMHARYGYGKTIEECMEIEEISKFVIFKNTYDDNDVFTIDLEKCGKKILQIMKEKYSYIILEALNDNPFEKYIEYVSDIEAATKTAVKDALATIKPFRESYDKFKFIELITKCNSRDFYAIRRDVYDKYYHEND